MYKSSIQLSLSHLQGTTFRMNLFSTDEGVSNLWTYWNGVVLSFYVPFLCSFPGDSSQIFVRNPFEQISNSRVFTSRTCSKPRQKNLEIFGYFLQCWTCLQQFKNRLWTCSKNWQNLNNWIWTKLEQNLNKCIWTGFEQSKTCSWTFSWNFGFSGFQNSPHREK
jgi:hypothetical protein